MGKKTRKINMFMPNSSLSTRRILMKAYPTFLFLAACFSTGTEAFMAPSSSSRLHRKAATPFSLASSYAKSPNIFKVYSKATPSEELEMESDAMENDSSMKETDEITKSTDSLKKNKPLNPTPALFSFLEKVKQQGPLAAIATMALALALTLSPDSASAAMSGGRMGGSFSSSYRPSVSSYSPSRSSSYGSGYSRSFQSGFGSGYASGYLSRPSISVSPFYNPYSYAYSRPLVYGGGSSVISYNRGPSLFDMILVGGVGFMIWSAIRGGPSFSEGLMASADAFGSGTTVAQISVALEVPNRDDRNSILAALDRISRSARTDSRVGIQNLTSQVALELLRRKSSIVSAHTNYKHFGNYDKGQREFSSRSTKERSKFEQETVNKYGGVDYSLQLGKSGLGPSADNPKATMAVVTLVMAVDGDSTKLPKVGSIRDVEEALRKLATDAKVDNGLQSAEILWTPEDRSESLSVRDVVADYPELRAV